MAGRTLCSSTCGEDVLALACLLHLHLTPDLTDECGCSWLPLASGDGTLYLEACPHMSWFLYTGMLDVGRTHQSLLLA